MAYASARVRLPSSRPGSGWCQCEGGVTEEIWPSDVVWFSPGEKHWHGATPTTAMTHIAIQEKKDGKVVDWMEKVSEEQTGNKGV
jgi:quercetin dioxygenase-like cupin family protein